MNHILITGGTGFIGHALVKSLSAKGKRVTILTRDASKQGAAPSNQVVYVEDLAQIVDPQSIDGVINLAGESLAAKRWNDAQKAKIIDSRISTTHHLVEWVQSNQIKLKVWINGSAIGWYGPQDSAGQLDEESGYVRSFSHELCAAWEQACEPVSALCERLIKMRIGIVLEADGGPLAAMLLPFKLGLGGKMGSGKQQWSWIHRADLIRLTEEMLDNPSYQGVINATAPGSVTQKAFAQTLAKTLKRPCIAPMPAAIAKLMIGEFASEVLLQGQQVFPKRAIDKGFEFKYPELSQALGAILK